MKNIKFKLNIINKILTPIVTIISNIKYLFCVNMSDFKASQELWNMASTNQYSNLYNRVDKIYDNIDIENIEDKMYDMSNSIDDIQNDLEDKASEYQIQDIIHDTFGYSEDYVNYDDMNDIKGDIKEINNKLNDINNVVDDNIFIDNNKRLNLKEWDLLVNDIIKSIINRLRYDGDNDNV